MQNKPANWVTGFKRSPRAANVQNRDMGLFLNSSGKFEPIDDAWDSIHSGGIFISGDNKLYFRDETNKDIYINSPEDDKLTIGATSGVGINTTAAETLHVVDTTSEGGVLIDNTATDGNPILAFGLSGTKTFTMGVDDGDSDKFKIFSGAAIDGTSEFVIDGSGNVGIGATAPLAPFEVKSTTNPIAMFSYNDSYNGEVFIAGTQVNAGYDRNANATLYLNYNGYANGTTQFRDTIIADGKNNTVLMSDGSAGNVGIGAAPGTLLELNGTAPYLTIKNSTHEDGDGGREGRIIFEGEQSGGEISTLAQIQASHDGTSDDQKGDLIFYTNDGNDNAAPNERMRIDSAGYVGIGTASPSSALQIGDGSGSSDNTIVRVIGGNSSGYSQYQFGDSDNNAMGKLQYNHSDNSLKTFVNNADVMTINSSGNVGIGAAPGTLLELFGTAPYLTLRNSTHEDGDGGRESKIIFEGEQSGGEDSTLAVIQASHDGTSDDQKGDLIFYTNDGNDNAAPTEAVRIDSGGNVAIGKGAADTGISLNSGSGNDSYINFNEGGSNKSYIRNEGTDDSFRINVASADRVTIDTSGNVEIDSGNLVIGTAGKGIDFQNQASPAAGMTSELLDRYEEGTFTPAVTFGGNSASLAYTHRAGAYTRIGRSVTVTMSFLLSAKGSSTGSAKVTGLPFTVGDNLGSTALEASASLSIYNNMASLTDSNLSAAAIHSETYLQFYYNPAGANEATEGNFTDTSDVRLTITYFV